MAYMVPKECTWLEELPESICEDKSFQRIICFFMVHSLVKGTSARGKNLKADYGWHSPWSKPFYLNKQLKELSSNKHLLFSASVYDQKPDSKKHAETMEEGIIKAVLDAFPQYDSEKICVYDSKKNQILSTFAHIRNSFAHCRFNAKTENGKKIYCLEDVDTKMDAAGNVKVSARIVLFESTLLAWINLIQAGEREYEKKESSEIE